MSKETREIISSLMDGEVSREASRFLVRRIGSDEELHATWARYHVVRDCLRNRGEVYARSDLSVRVRNAIADEERPRGRFRQARRWLKPVGGAGIAASVALLAVLAVNPGGAPPVNPTESLVDQNVSQPFSSPQGIPITPVISRTVSTNRMGPYLLRHYQVAGAGQGRAIVGFVPVMVSNQRLEAAEPEAVNPDENKPVDSQ